MSLAVLPKCVSMNEGALGHFCNPMALLADRPNKSWFAKPTLLMRVHMHTHTHAHTHTQIAHICMRAHTHSYTCTHKYTPQAHTKHTGPWQRQRQ